MSVLYASPLTQLCWPPPSICCQASSIPRSFVPCLNTTSASALPSPQKGGDGPFSLMGTTAPVKRYVCSLLCSSLGSILTFMRASRFLSGVHSVQARVKNKLNQNAQDKLFRTICSKLTLLACGEQCKTSFCFSWHTFKASSNLNTAC